MMARLKIYYQTQLRDELKNKLGLKNIFEVPKIKKIVVNPNSSLSLQMHKHRSEHWVVVEGNAKVQVNDEVKILSKNESVYIPLGVKHRLSNPTKSSLILIEIQSGNYLGEDDIKRFDDIYGR